MLLLPLCVIFVLMKYYFVVPHLLTLPMKNFPNFLKQFPR